MSSINRRPSVTDVASAAGVSVGTVSNVLNRPAVVAAATRERVEAAIRELGFVRSGPARQLRQGAVTTVGVLVSDIRNPFFTDVARGIEDRLAADDYTLMLASVDGDRGREAKYLRLFEEHGVAGLIVVPTDPRLAQLQQIQSRGGPVVLLDVSSDDPALSSVSVDDVAGGALAVGHLFDQGHERVVFLNGDHTIPQCAARSVGAARAAAAAGLRAEAIDELRIARLDAASGDRALTAWIEAHGGDAPPAIFCVNDLVAIGVQRCLRRRGGTALLTRTAVVGYDDIDVAGELAQPLTSVRQPTHAMGYTAAEILLGHVAGAPARHKVFTPELVVRASSTPATR